MQMIIEKLQSLKGYEYILILNINQVIITEIITIKISGAVSSVYAVNLEHRSKSRKFFRYNDSGVFINYSISFFT
jgi:hypothetical protein